MYRLNYTCIGKKQEKKKPSSGNRSCPGSRVPRRVLDQLSRMSVQAHDTLQDQVRHVEDRKQYHRPAVGELGAYSLGEVKSGDESSESREEKPFCQWVLEEDETRERRAVVGEVRDYKADKKACVLRDEVEAQFAGDEKGEDSGALHGAAFTVGRVGPDQGKVTDGCLGPAWVIVSV
jgi:hypothetical protein